MIESQIIVDVINKSLRDLFGSDIVTGQSIFRIVWSENEFEKRYGTFDDISPNGVFIRSVTEVREVPKYRQWIHSKHILERLVVVPEFQQKELAGAQISYEPLHVFQDGNERYLPPRLDVAQFIINTVLAAQEISKMMLTGQDMKTNPLARYRKTTTDEQDREIELASIMEELSGDDSGLGGETLPGGSAIIVPHTYNKD